MLPIVQSIIDYICSNLDRELTTRKLARLVSLSPSRTGYLFKIEMGMSIAKFVKNQRLEKARELLETTPLSVKEVRVRVGVTDRSHFDRDFKQAYGITPAGCRRQSLFSGSPFEVNERTKRDKENSQIGHK